MRLCVLYGSRGWRVFARRGESNTWEKGARSVSHRRSTQLPGRTRLAQVAGTTTVLQFFFEI